MKKNILLGLALLLTSSVFAQLNGDGFYRVQNKTTGRFIYVLDNKGSISMATTSADLLAIKLYLDFDKAVSDPATILYVKTVGSQYDLLGQGTGVYQIIGHYVSLLARPNGSYWAYASASGLTKYLGDAEYSDSPDGGLTSEGTGDHRDWSIKPINQTDGYYFGVKPEITDATGNYRSFYASFAFSMYSSDTKAFYISRIKNNMAVMKEITGVIPASTPVIFKCVSANVADNKLNIQVSDLASPSDNLLQGTFFCNKLKTHFNVVVNNPTTMRIFGTLSDGSIGFKSMTVADLPYVPANKAYLVVPAGTPDELKMVTEEAAGVEGVKVESIQKAHGVYTIGGARLSDHSTTDGLQPGLYIVGGNKQVVR